MLNATIKYFNKLALAIAFAILSFTFLTQIAEARLAPNARRAVVLEAFHALRPSADGGCDRTINGNCVSSWNYLNDDYWAYDQLKKWYGCASASVWERIGYNGLGNLDTETVATSPGVY